MRTDARIDRKQVVCPNTSHLGFDKYKAQFGDIVVFNEGERSKVGRVIGRIDYAPALEGDKEPTRNYLVVAALSENPRPHYDHILVITPTVLVGRNV